MKCDCAGRLVLALLSPEDLRLRGVAPGSGGGGGGLHARRQEPPGCGRVGEHAAQVGVHHRGGRRSVLSSSSVSDCCYCCFQLSPSDSRPHWHTTGKELRRPAPRRPISRGARGRGRPPARRRRRSRRRRRPLASPSATRRRKPGR